MFIGCLAFILIFTVPWFSSMEEPISFGQLLYCNLDNRALWAGVKKALRKGLLKSIK